MGSVSLRAVSLAVGLAAASTAGATVFTDFNLVVRGNLASASEVEGRSAVGGNLSGPASNYGIGLNAQANLGVDVLLVGGNLFATNINMNAGNLRLGGSQGSTNVNFNGGGQLISDNTTGAQVASLGAQMLAASSFLSGLAATNTVTIPNGQPGPLNFNAIPGGNGVAVFNVDGNQIFNNNFVQQMDIALNGASSVIINVSGASVNWTDGNMVGAFNSLAARSTVMWNFHEATSLNFGGRAMNGAVLAPNASLFFQGVIEGSLWVNSLDQKGEVHLPNYTGYVPAPGSAALMGLGVLAMARRRR